MLFYYILLVTMSAESVDEDPDYTTIAAKIAAEYMVHLSKFGEMNGEKTIFSMKNTLDAEEAIKDGNAPDGILVVRAPLSNGIQLQVAAEDRGQGVEEITEDDVISITALIGTSDAHGDHNLIINPQTKMATLTVRREDAKDRESDVYTVNIDPDADAPPITSEEQWTAAAVENLLSYMDLDRITYEETCKRASDAAALVEKKELPALSGLSIEFNKAMKGLLRGATLTS